MAEEAKWYVVHTYSGYENKVADSIVNAVENRQLHHLITDVKIPTEMVVEIKDDGQKVEKEQKLFPSYVFVKMIMTDDSWYVVRNIRGVTLCSRLFLRAEPIDPFTHGPAVLYCCFY